MFRATDFAVVVCTLVISCGRFKLTFVSVVVRKFFDQKMFIEPNFIATSVL